MKAVLFEQYGGPEVLKLGEMPDAVPGPDEMLIKVHAIGVNPADGKWRSGMLDQLAPLQFPAIVGYDIAGEVIGGKGLPVGSRVAAMVDIFRSGAYAEQVVATADRVAIIPEGMDYATAAGVPTPGLTALQAIDENLAVKQGQRVLVTGAVGAVGRYGMRAAKLSGATVVAAVRESARAEAEALGADEVITLDGTEYGGPEFDCILDTVGGEVVAPLCRRVRADGRICTVATTPIPIDGVPVAIDFYGVHPDSNQLATLLQWVNRGDVSLPLVATLPLAEAAEGQRRVDAGGTGGKIILLP